MNRRQSYQIVLVAMSCVLLFACGAVGKDLLVALGGDVEGWDPVTEVFYAAGEIVRNCYDNIVNFSVMGDEESPYGVPVGQIQVEGGLAESWEWSEDGTVITFHLREGVVFPSGNPLTAEDIRWNVERGLNLPGGGLWSWNVMAVTSMDQIAVIDEHTVQFTLPQPNSLFLPMYAVETKAVVDSAEAKTHATAEDPYAHEWLLTNVASTGAYHLERFSPAEEIVLAANEDYWGGKPAIDRVVYKIVPAEETRVLLLKNGDVDISLFISPEQVEKQLVDQTGIRVVNVPTPGCEYFAVNSEMEPFDNLLVRRALAYATPYDDIIENVLYGFGVRATSPVPLITPWHRDVSPYTYDIAKARELLELAGYPDGFEFSLSYQLDNPVEEAIAIYLQDAYADIGVDLIIDKVAASRFSQIRRSGEYESILVYFIPYVNSPIYMLNIYDSPTANYGRYWNQDFSNLKLKAIVELDLEKQQGMVNAMQQILIDGCGIVFLHHPNRITCMRDDVSGYVYFPDHLIRYKYMDK